MPRPRDTSDLAHGRQRDALRAMSPAARLALAAALSDDVRAVAAAGIRARRPGDSESHVAAALARIVLGRELARAAHRVQADTSR
jgi:hypothetical protein